MIATRRNGIRAGSLIGLAPGVRPSAGTKTTITGGPPLKPGDWVHITGMETGPQTLRAVDTNGTVEFAGNRAQRRKQWAINRRSAK